MNTRLSVSLERRRALSEFQCGFRTRRGTHDHLLTLYEVASCCAERGGCLYMAFLDVAKAYDRTWRNGLWYRLRQVGVTDRALRLFQSSYASVRRAVIVNDRVTESFECRSGVSQGAVDSPTLYDVFIDGVAAELYGAGFGATVAGIRVPLLMYADDVVLLSECPNQLQRMLNAVTRYAERWQFTYNTSKSAVVVAGRASTRDKVAARQRVWTLAGGRLPVPDYYTYLGVEFGLLGPGLWVPAVSRLLNAARGRTRELLYVNGNKFGLNPVLQMRLWNAYCRPILEYACPLWGPRLSTDTAHDLETVQLRYAKAALGLEQRTASAFVRGELGIRTLAARRDELTLRMFGELLCHSKDDRLSARVIRARWLDAREGRAPRSWCAAVQPILERYGLESTWEAGIGGVSMDAWRKRVHEAVSKKEEEDWRAEVLQHTSLSVYSTLKHRPFTEPYLSLNSSREGRLLLLQARSGTLPLAARLSAIAQSPPHAACRVCVGPERWGLEPVSVAIEPDTGSAFASERDVQHMSSSAAPPETLLHFFLHCPFLMELRDGLFARVLSSDVLPTLSRARLWFECASDSERLQWLLGGDMYQWSKQYAEAEGKSFTKEDKELYCSLTAPRRRALVTRHVQHFLLLAWRLRDRLNGGRVCAVWPRANGWSVECEFGRAPPIQAPATDPASIAASASDAALYSSVHAYVPIETGVPWRVQTPSRFILSVEPCVVSRSAERARRIGRGLAA